MTPNKKNQQIIKAIVLRADRKNYHCLTTDTKEEVLAIPTNALLKTTEVVVGDNVKLIKNSNGELEINEVEKRENELYRMLVREKRKKVTAANIDIMAIVVTCSKPQYKNSLLDRYLIRAEQFNIKPIIIFNKKDEYKENKKLDLKFEQQKFKYLNIESFFLSALFPDKFEDFKKLQSRIKGQKIVFLGQSGVGKSRLIQSLCNEDITLKSSSLGKAQKGKHTTTWSQLIFFKNLILLDTPGIKSFSLEDITKEDLIHYFPDLHQLSLKCRFPNCKHQKDNASCAIWKEIDEVNNATSKIVSMRLDSYFQISKSL